MTLFTSHRNDRTQSIFFTDFVSIHKTYPVMDAHIHGVHDGTSYNPVWRKLQKFL